MKTITRRAAIAASVTLPLLPVSAFASPTVEAGSDKNGGLAELLYNLERLPPDLRKACIAFIHTLADEQQNRKAGVAS